MIALISDIHGNFDALKAVFNDIDSYNVNKIYFLGDVVGYGPEPEKCINLLKKRCNVHLLGNHDLAMLTIPAYFNPVASKSIECQKARMKPKKFSLPGIRKRWKYLGELEERHQDKNFLFVHASPRDPLMEYVIPSDPIRAPEKVSSMFEYVEQFAFCGHTHLPGVMTPEPAWLTLEALSCRYKLGREKAIINIGSVGQPRDHDPRACYVILGEDEIEWRRIEYDIEKTVEKIKKFECLPSHNWQRLLKGV